MLTQFSNFKKGSAGIRHAVFTGRGLGIERLGLLLQASRHSKTLCPLAHLQLHEAIVWILQEASNLKDFGMLFSYEKSTHEGCREFIHLDL